MVVYINKFKNSLSCQNYPKLMHFLLKQYIYFLTYTEKNACMYSLVHSSKYKKLKKFVLFQKYFTINKRMINICVDKVHDKQ